MTLLYGILLFALLSGLREGVAAREGFSRAATPLRLIVGGMWGVVLLLYAHTRLMGSWEMLVGTDVYVLCRVFGVVLLLLCTVSVVPALQGDAGRSGTPEGLRVFAMAEGGLLVAALCLMGPDGLRTALPAVLPGVWVYRLVSRNGAPMPIVLHILAAVSLAVFFILKYYL